MTFGIKIWGPDGTVWMDSSLVTWNIIEQFTVDAAGDVTKSYADYDGYSFLVIQIPLEVPKVDDYTYEKTISVTGTSIRIYGGNQKASILVLAR